MYQELSVRNDHVQIGYFGWIGYSQEENMLKDNLSCNLRLGFPFYINGMTDSKVNGFLFSPLIDYGPRVNGVAFSPLLATGQVNGITIALNTVVDGATGWR